MATATPKKPAADRPVLVPPEEQFWKRYSPHHEFPLSSAGSVALHILAVAVLLLLALFIIPGWFKVDRSLPVEPVRLEIEGGGGGSPTGEGDRPGIGHGPEDVPDKKETAREGDEKAPDRPDLKKPAPTTPDKVEFNDADKRYISERSTEVTRAFKNLDDFSRRRFRPDGMTPGKGKGGPGSGGGKDKGKGTGEGPGKGPGKATLSQREKRMLRWSMHFNTTNGFDYLRQLNGLGAILAIPVREVPRPHYRIVRDLTRRPAKLLNEDVSKIHRIYWIDDHPKSVLQVMNALGVNLRPSRFVAFMPEELEKKLFEMEKNHMENVLKQPYDEDRIFETHFKVVNDGGGYRPEIIEVKLKPR
jgi:hypothetical protein